MADGAKKNLEQVIKEWREWWWRIKDAAEEWYSEFKAEDNLIRKIGHKGIANGFTEFYRVIGIPVPRTAMYATLLALIAGAAVRFLPF